MSFNDHRAAEIRQSTFGKDMREPIAKSVEKIRDHRDRKVSEIEVFHGERVNSVTLTPYQEGSEDIMVLHFHRANGR